MAEQPQSISQDQFALAIIREFSNYVSDSEDQNGPDWLKQFKTRDEAIVDFALYLTTLHEDAGKHAKRRKRKA